MSDISSSDGAGEPLPTTEYEAVAQVDGQKPAKRWWLIGGGITLVVVFSASALAVGLLTGDAVASLEAVPSDVDFVVTLDLLQLSDAERIDALVSAFAEPLEDAGYIDSAEIDLFGQISEDLEDELGVNLFDDLLPWIGRSVTVAGWLPADFFTSPDPDILLVVTVRNRDAAAEFLEQVADGDFEITTMEDGDLYVGTETVGVFWLGDDLLLAANSRVVIRDALNARSGESLADDEVFSSVLNELPAEPLLTFFAGPGIVDSIADASSELGPTSPLDGFADGFRGAAIAITLVDSGIRFDIAQLLEGDIAEQAAQPDEVSGVAALPLETLGYAGTVIPDNAIGDLLEEFRALDPVAYDEITVEAQETLGVDLLGEVLPSFGGEMLLSVIQTRDGFLAEESGISIGLLVTMGVLDTAPISATIASLEELAIQEQVVIDEGTPSVARFEGNEIVAYQVTDDALVIGSASSVVSDFLSGDGELTNGELYRELDAALPGDGLSFYVDLSRIFDIAEMSRADRAIVEPLRAIGASSSFDGELVTGTLLILIDY
jgi:hypothetical protein